jgi:hypothetical protein
MSTKPPNYSFQFFPFSATRKVFFFLLLCRTDFYNPIQNKTRNDDISGLLFYVFILHFRWRKKKINKYKQIFLSPSLVPLSFCDLFEYNGHDLPQTFLFFFWLKRADFLQQKLKNMSSRSLYFLLLSACVFKTKNPMHRHRNSRRILF